MSQDHKLSPLLEQLAERLSARENLELEFKAGRVSLPKSLWPTVSAFANTRGGWIVLGVSLQDDQLIVEGVGKAYKQIEDLFNLMRNPNKISCAVTGPDDVSVETLDGRDIIVLRAPAAPRTARPVYIDGNPYAGTYVRRHAGDYHCSRSEVNRMMREASDVAPDSAVLPTYTLGDINGQTLTRYRRRYEIRNPGSPFNSYDNQPFLQAIGAHGHDRQSGQEGLTVAGLLLLGIDDAVREWRSRHLIDYRLVGNDQGPDARWEDRVAWEGNLYDAYEAIYARLTAEQPIPFRLAGDTRVDEGQVHVVLREALVNLLVHADYTETQASLILRSPTGYLFRNPGSSRVLFDDMLTGDRSDPRNPELVRMFRLVGLAEEAGTGIPKIISSWRRLGYQLPRIDVGSERYEFALSLRYLHLLPEEDRAWLGSLAEGLAEPEQLALVIAKHEGDVDNSRLRNLTGQHPADVTKILGGLRNVGLLEVRSGGRGTYYQLTSRAIGRLPTEPAIVGNALPTEPAIVGNALPADVPTVLMQAARSLGQRAGPQRVRTIILMLCTWRPLHLSELAAILNRNEHWILTRYLRPLLQEGLLEYTHPTAPRHPSQAYRSTEAGQAAIPDSAGAGP